MKGSRFSEEQIIGIVREHEAGAKAPDICRRHGISDATFYYLWTAPPWQEGSGSWSGDDRLQTSIRRHLIDGAPKWDIRSHSPRQMVGLEGHYKSQGLSVPVRSVSPFSDPSSNLAQPSRSGAVRLATGQHGPDYPCVLIGDRDRRAVITAPLAKLVDPHTS
jgi:hypothetical protein